MHALTASTVFDQRSIYRFYRYVSFRYAVNPLLSPLVWFSTNGGNADFHRYAKTVHPVKCAFPPLC